MAAQPQVLIVDDNLINLKLACEVLESDKFEVKRASSAEEALVLLKSYTPDLMLLDIGMPGIDGFMLTIMLKNSSATRNLPIVALTASAMKGDDIRAFNAGFDGYLTKPINTRTFASQVKEFIKPKK
jgi:two-component system, cell cycle response regulator DivK